MRVLFWGGATQVTPLSIMLRGWLVDIACCTAPKFGKSAWFVLTIIVLSNITPAHAAQPDPAAGTEGGRLLRGLENQLPAQQSLPAPTERSKAQIPHDMSTDEVHVTIRGFILEGNQSLPESLIQETLKPWIGKEVGLAQLQQAADAVATLYQSHGLMATVSLPPQRIEGGLVILKIVVGRLGEVNIELPSGPSRFGVERARERILASNTKGENIRPQSIEKAMISLNEIPGVAAATELVPGKNDGDVDVRVALTDTPLVRGKLEASNYGSRSTGILQGAGTVVLDNPSGIGDQASANSMVSEGSQYIQVGYSIPVTYSGIRVGITTSNLDYHNVGVFSYPVNQNAGYGTATTVGLNITYPLLRATLSNVNFTAGIDHKNYQNKLSAINAYTSAYTLQTANAGFTGNLQDHLGGGGATTGSINTVLGHLSLGANNPANYGIYTPKTFVKVNFGLNRTQQIVPDELILNLSVNAQLASVDLDSAEKFYLGGPNAVRAYPVSQGAGSQGAVFSAELQKALPGKFKASIFLDAGFVQQYKNSFTYVVMKGATNANNTYTLSGAGFSIKNADRRSVLSASVAWRIGTNSLYANNGQPLNNDARALAAYAWVQAQWYF